MPGMFTGCPRGGIESQPIIFSKEIFNHYSTIFLVEVKSLLILANLPVFCILFVFLTTVA